MRQGRKTGLVSAAAAVVLATTACGLGGGGDDDAESSAAAPSAEETEQAAAAFLAAWADGDTGAAAALTDDPGAGAAAMDAFAEDAGVTELSLTPGRPDGDTVPFTVRATVTHEEYSAEWNYDSQLTVVRPEDGGEPVVAWQPGVVHPELAAGRSLELGPGDGAVAVVALASDGEPLDAEEHPSLAPLLAELGERYGEESGGTPGVALRFSGGGGDEAADEPLLTLAEPAGGEITTTIDRAVQQAAEKALAETPEASLVAVEPSTGAIRAVVNTPPDGENRALAGRNSPGSTWKIVTAGLLLEEDLAEPQAAHPCPKFFEYGDWEFHNLDEFDIKGGTFTESFAASCNTAFISQAPELTDEQLGDYARDAFGVGLEWETGVEALSGSVPVESNAQKAAQMIGQAGVLVNPLVMASVSATVKDGTFRQPYLVSPEVDGRELVTADGPSAETAEQLRGLMKATATGGTAAEAMSGLEGDIGAKTGSAEVFDQDKPNAWFTAYRNDLAVAAVVPDSGHGGKFAGPLVAEVLRSAG